MYELKLYNETDLKPIDDNSLDLSDAKSCVKVLNVQINDEESNNYKIYQENGKEWVDVIKRNSKIYFYIKENYDINPRYCYVEIENYYTNENFSLTITQPECVYKIEISEYSKSSNTFKNIDDEIEFTVDVYGGSKNINIVNETISIVKDEIVYDYDNSLYYIIQMMENMEDHKKYKLIFKFLGDFENRIEYSYNVPLIHYDNFNTVKSIVFDVKLQEIEILAINKIFDDIYNEQPENEYEKIKNINKENLNNKFSDEQKSKNISMINVFSLEEKSIEYHESIEIISKTIEDNKIKLIIDTYPEYDSLILVKPNANWVKYDSVLYKDKKVHEVIIWCEQNYWKTQRKTLVFLTNAENQEETFVYLITQEGNNDISFDLYQKVAY